MMIQTGLRAPTKYIDLHITRALLDLRMLGSQQGDVVGPFFGFMGAAAALVFACEFEPPNAHVYM